MVAPVSASDAPVSATESPPGTEAVPGHSTGQRLAASLLRLVNLETRMLLTRVKLTALRLALFVGLFVAATVSGVLGLIFLYIGAWKFLAEAIGPAWAFIGFAGFHLMVAAVLIFIARGLLSGSDEGAGAG